MTRKAAHTQLRVTRKAACTQLRGPGTCEERRGLAAFAERVNGADNTKPLSSGGVAQPRDSATGHDLVARVLRQHQGTGPASCLLRFDQ